MAYTGEEFEDEWLQSEGLIVYGNNNENVLEVGSENVAAPGVEMQQNRDYTSGNHGGGEFED